MSPWRKHCTSDWCIFVPIYVSNFHFQFPFPVSVSFPSPAFPYVCAKCADYNYISCNFFYFHGLCRPWKYVYNQNSRSMVGTYLLNTQWCNHSHWEYKNLTCNVTQYYLLQVQLSKYWTYCLSPVACIVCHGGCSLFSDPMRRGSGDIQPTSMFTQVVHSWTVCGNFPFSISPVQWEGRTALMKASEGDYLHVVKELLRAQAGVDLQDEVCCLYIPLTLQHRWQGFCS